MNPNSLALQIVVGVALAGVLALAIWRWNRFRRRFLSRFLALLVIQVLALTTVALVVNRAGEFLTTWPAVVGSEAGIDPLVFADRGTLAGHGELAGHRELAGHGEPAGRGAGVGAVAGNSISPFDPNPWRPTPAQRRLDMADAHASRLVQVTLTGAATGYRLPALIYLPGSYASDASRRFPMFQMESGYTGSFHTWTASAGLQSTVDNLTAAGQLPAVVVVMPEQYPILGRDSECVDADPALRPGSLADTYLSHDVLLYMRTHFRVGLSRSDLIIGGFSTGGYCAANLALRHSSVYGGAMVLSGYFRTIIDHTTGPLFADRTQTDANAPMVTIGRHHRPLAWFLSAAQDAPTDVRFVTNFLPLVPSSDRLHVVYTKTGGHSAAAWRVSSRIGFVWMASVLSQQ